jgi:tetratricopeptide (TPR) repeat protein
LAELVLREAVMKQHRILLLTASSALLLALSLPANAFVVVIGNQLAHDCYIAAKTGVDPQTGIATCNSALENEALSTHDRAGTFVNRGTMEIALNRVPQAMSDYNEGVEIMPTLGDSYVDRAGGYIYTHQYALAIADANKGIALGPSLPFVGYYNRAVAEHLSGDLQHAYFDYQKTLELEPRFTPAADQLKGFVVTKRPDAPTLANGPADPNAPIPANEPKQPDANAPTLAGRDTSLAGIKLGGGD